MENQKQEKPLKILQRHEPMKLYKVVDKELTTSEDLYKEFILWITKTNYSMNTLKSYCKNVNNFRKTLGLFKPTIRASTVEDFLKNKTIVYHASIKCFLEFVEEEWHRKFEYIKYPAIKKYEKKIPIVLSEKEVYGIIEHIPESYKFFTRFLYLTAMRISEPLRLRVSSININTWKNDKSKHPLITITHTKSNRERQIAFKPEILQEIESTIINGDCKTRDQIVRETKILQKKIDRGDDIPKKEMLLSDYLFDFDIERYLNKKYKKARKEQIFWYRDFKTTKEEEAHLKEYAMKKYIDKQSRYFQTIFRTACFEYFNKTTEDIQENYYNKRYYTPHTLRRSRATQMLKAGISILKIRDFLGHKSVKVTEDYLNSGIEEIGDDMKRLGL